MAAPFTDFVEHRIAPWSSSSATTCARPRSAHPRASSTRPRSIRCSGPTGSASIAWGSASTTALRTATTRRRWSSRARWARARSGSGSAPRWCSRRSTTRSSSPRTRPSPRSPRTGACCSASAAAIGRASSRRSGASSRIAGASVGETIALLRLAWTGEPFEWQGRHCRVTPRPDPAPPILLGGGSAAAARRAARIADGWFPPLEPKLWPPYRDECRKLGKPDPGEYPNQGPIFLWVSKEPDKDWDRLMPHVLHQLRSYSEWTIEAYGRPSGPYAKQMTPETVRESAAYRVLTPEQTLALAEQLGANSVLYLNPLLAGIDPAFARRMLDLFEREVHPTYEPGTEDPHRRSARAGPHRRAARRARVRRAARPSRSRSTPCSPRRSSAPASTTSAPTTSASGSRSGSRRWTRTPSAPGSRARRSGTTASAARRTGCGSARCCREHPEIQRVADRAADHRGRAAALGHDPPREPDRRGCAAALAAALGEPGARAGSARAARARTGSIRAMRAARSAGR